MGTAISLRRIRYRDLGATVAEMAVAGLLYRGVTYIRTTTPHMRGVLCNNIMYYYTHAMKRTAGCGDDNGERTIESDGRA